MIFAGQQPSVTLPEPSLLHYGLWCSAQAPGSGPFHDWTGGHKNIAVGFKKNETDFVDPKFGSNQRIAETSPQNGRNHPEAHINKVSQGFATDGAEPFSHGNIAVGL